MNPAVLPEATHPGPGRLRFLDYAKLAGVFLVLSGHVLAEGDARNFIYAFHIPLFFVAAGLVLRPCGPEGVGKFLLRKARGLLLPYVSLCLISYLWWLLAERSFRGASVPPIEPLWGLFYGANKGNLLLPNPSLWFLPCLFLAEMLAMLLLLRLRTWWWLLMCALGLAALAPGAAGPEPLPWGLGTAPAGAFFMLLGFLAQPLVPRLLASALWARLAGGSGLLLVCLLVSRLNGAVSMDATHYGSPLLFAVGAVAGSAALLLLLSTAPSLRMAEYLGANTLLLFGLGDPCRRAVMFLMTRMGLFTLGELRDSVPLACLCAALSIILLVPLVVLINRRLPWLAGTGVRGGVRSAREAAPRTASS